MARKKKQLRSRPGKAGGASGRTKRDLSATFEGLEIAKGYDGPLRGRPEPALLLAAYGQHVPPVGSRSAAPEQARLLARCLVRFPVDASAPYLCAPPPGASMRMRIFAPARVLFLAIALEEDDGDDITSTYVHLEDLRALSIWNGRSAVPDPCAIADLFDEAAWAVARGEPGNEENEPTAVRVIAGGKDLGDSCERDDYIGAAAMRFELNGPTDRVVRARTVSANEKNDWTALLRIVVR